MEFLHHLTPEQVKEMQRKQAFHRDHSSATAHAVIRLFHELKKDDIEALAGLFSYLANCDDKAGDASYWLGIITHVMQARFSICSVCGENHDADLEEILEDAEEEPPASSKRTVFWTPIGSSVPLQSAERKVMVNHNLDDLRDRETNKLLGFICNGCGQRYVSIQDRTLRQSGPGGCDGCMHKMRWG